jgi:hypothetical protein
MTTEQRVRRSGGPVLVYTTSKVRRQAEVLLPGRVVETEVSRAIAAGAVEGGRDGGFVFMDEWGVVARYAKTPRRFGGTRRAWLVTSLARKRGDAR